jgi:addiction module HigA family antidote
MRPMEHGADAIERNSHARSTPFRNLGAVVQEHRFNVRPRDVGAFFEDGCQHALVFAHLIMISAIDISGLLVYRVSIYNQGGYCHAKTAAPHPGETILEDILKPLGMSVNALAKALGITAARLNEIVRGRRGITADTALRLARYLGTSAEFWLSLQLEYDLRVARQAKQKDIERAVRPRSVAAA